MDIATELLLLAMPAWILFDLQMARRTKIIILSAFALRVPVILAAAVHFAFAYRWTSSTHPLVDIVTPFICLQVEVHYATMATTFPCIGPLMKSLNTRWGALDGAASSSYAMGSMGGRGEKYANSSSAQHGKRSRHSQLASKIGTGRVALTPHANNYSSRIGAEQAERRPSIGSDGSEQMIIRKTVETIVEREDQ
ncbi:hypothetical protein LTR17_002920 [Elasticomyces elasticus]|nr:hypothetical protein LTR17_002920 [Elasticomyces elasticus]